MAFTKKIVRHDFVEIDGTDVSNAFHTFALASADTDEDVSGFSISGVDETLPGGRAQGFTGEAFYTEELAALVWPIYNARAVVQIIFKPDGLVNADALTYYANCTISEFNPSDTRGSPSTFPFVAKTADTTGIVQAEGT